MRILLTTDTVGGVWTYTKELTEGLLSSDCAVTLVSFGRPPSADQESWANATCRAFPHTFSFVPSSSPLEWMQNNAGCYDEPARLLLRLVHTFHPDVFHSNQLCFGALSFDVPKLVAFHSDVRSWSLACRGREPDPSPWFTYYDHMVSRGLHAADHVVAPTRWMLDRAHALYRIPGESSVICNGRSVPPAPQSDRKLQAVTAGRLWDEAKNIEVLRGCESPIPILIAGETAPPEAPGLNALDLPHATSLGRLDEDEMLRLLRESAIYIVTSRYEPFGLAAVEATLCGCAIIANDIPSLREVWGDTALFFTDAAGLSAILTRLAEDPHALQHAAQAALKRAQTLYTSGNMVAHYLDLYRSLVVRSKHQEEVTLDVA